MKYSSYANSYKHDDGAKRLRLYLIKITKYESLLVEAMSGNVSLLCNYYFVVISVAI
jgi:hypothetical protein